MEYKKAIYDLIKEASTKLPQDVIDVISSMRAKEEAGGNADSVLGTILDNINRAKTQELPICQDTGMVFLDIYYPTGFSTLEMRKAIEEAVIEATKANILRPNAVDIVTGENSGTNIGIGSPSLYFTEWEKEHFEFRLMLKGGGSENVGIQFKLPDSDLKAGRDLDGVKRCVLEGVFKAQGLGCAPGILGIGIGGDRGGSYYLSKKQLFRKVGERNPNAELAKLEMDILNSANQLGIGPMGFGGNTTLLDVMIGCYHRHPATYYVTVTYLCWAGRRKVMTLNKDGGYTID
ncbi:MAG: fumarate hydratase [Spirochaetota bacterium]|nr:fumarate hydratase [Spirochaetota bacterium]